MSGENKAIAQRVVDKVYNQGNLDLIDDLFAPDFVYHDPLTPEEGIDREGYREFVAYMRAALPDIKILTLEMIAEGDTVAQRWTWSATHLGEMFGAAPTGKRVTDEGVSWCRVREGKVAELRIAPDALGVLQQLGVVPELEPVAT